MRIGMFTDVYKPHVSGITNYISLNKKHLEKLGHEVFVFTFGDEDYQDDEPNVLRSPGMPLLETGYYLSLHYSREARQVMRTLDIALKDLIQVIRVRVLRWLGALSMVVGVMLMPDLMNLKMRRKKV